MSEHSLEEVDKHVKIYRWVFGALVVLTVVTVLASYHKASIWLGVLIGLLIAVFKGSLVGAFFMHLFWEKKLIFGILAITFFFFAAMMGLILGHSVDVPVYR